ncbi:hypothetical protein PPSQR21_035550 [Paenibacillus polymyxa SQR-21]|uniref:hypothetical protein n=1 Tax=Paenibacillus polymyxa TaxID=1406 RepID=UPI00042E3EDB|nr:hypothetical protein [Paenibacillus polymyxa]AHM67193.1 hypothetical protein PPSQR21_035550 [Paenibacillus polymyxa SQR-21]
MGDSWFCWLDTLDGDYAVIGERADRIVNEDIYGEAFEYGSLYSILGHLQIANVYFQKN